MEIAILIVLGLIFSLLFTEVTKGKAWDEKLNHLVKIIGWLIFILVSVGILSLIVSALIFIATQIINH